jgi:N-acetylglutamate synthase-like GNAT family acetyltransferase
MVMVPHEASECASGADPVVVVDCDRARLDLSVIHGFLVRSHWAKGIPLPTLIRAIENSIPFGIYKDGRQIGFARVVTDHATFAYLADVFVIEEERGNGYGRLLVATVLDHPELQGMRRWLLGTRDAHGLYRPFGFGEPAGPFSFLEKLDGEVYATAAAA